MVWDKQLELSHWPSKAQASRPFLIIVQGLMCAIAPPGVAALHGAARRRGHVPPSQRHRLGASSHVLLTCSGPSDV